MCVCGGGWAGSDDDGDGRGPYITPDARGIHGLGNWEAT